MSAINTHQAHFFQLSDAVKRHIFIHPFILQIISYWATLERRTPEQLNIRTSSHTYCLNQEMSLEHLSVQAAVLILKGKIKS